MSDLTDWAAQYLPGQIDGAHTALAEAATVDEAMFGLAVYLYRHYDAVTLARLSAAALIELAQDREGRPS